MSARCPEGLGVAAESIADDGGARYGGAAHLGGIKATTGKLLGLLDKAMSVSLARWMFVERGKTKRRASRSRSASRRRHGHPAREGAWNKEAAREPGKMWLWLSLSLGASGYSVRVEGMAAKEKIPRRTRLGDAPARACVDEPANGR